MCEPSGLRPGMGGPGPPSGGGLGPEDTRLELGLEALVLSGAGRAPVALGSVTQASRPGPFCKHQPSLTGALCPGQGFHVPRHLHGMKEMVSPAAEASAGCGQWDARPEGCLLVCCGVRWC